MSNKHLSLNELRILRKRAVESIVLDGLSKQQAAMAFGFSRTSIWKYLKEYKSARCLVPTRNGVYYEDTKSWREALWDNYYTGAPEQQRIPVERYSYVKRA